MYIIQCKILLNVCMPLMVTSACRNFIMLVVSMALGWSDLWGYQPWKCTVNSLTVRSLSVTAS
jgi:hypothetical protein